jgi:hypothetical protein
VSVTALQAHAFACRLETLAGDVGRLRRRLADDAYNGHLICRISAHVEMLDAFLQPTAGELVKHGFAVDAALADADARARHFRSLLGEEAA